MLYAQLYRLCAIAVPSAKWTQKHILHDWTEAERKFIRKEKKRRKLKKKKRNDQYLRTRTLMFFLSDCLHSFSFI